MLVCGKVDSFLFLDFIFFHSLDKANWCGFFSIILKDDYF